MIDLELKYRTLIAREHAAKEALELLDQIEKDLEDSSGRARLWGQLAIFCHAMLVPLNCIVNAFQLGKARTAYQIAVRLIYDQFAKSGKQTESKAAKAILESFREAITAELKRRGLADQVPGVNILVGFALDAIALLEVADKYQKGSAEVSGQLQSLRNQMRAARSVLGKLGVERGHLLEAAAQRGRIA